MDRDKNTQKGDSPRLQRVPFVADRSAYCVWDFDLTDRVQDFLRWFRPEHYEYQANVHRRQLEEGTNQDAALALRSLYFHGLENLFALLGALVQAPTAVPAWLVRYRPVDLTGLVCAIHEQREVLSRLQLEPITWRSLSELVHQAYQEDSLTKEEVHDGFAALWGSFARDFLDLSLREEHNSLKHGLRVRPGGFGLAIGRERIPGVPAPPTEMHGLGKSTYGTEFFRRENLDKRGRNFRIRRFMRNWDPENMFWGVLLIAMSLKNVVAVLRFINGTPPDALKMFVPTAKDQFRAPWSKLANPITLNIDLEVPYSAIEPFTKSQILDSYGRKQDNDLSPYAQRAVIATTTRTGTQSKIDRVRRELALETLLQARAAGFAVVTVDDRSDDAFVEKAKAASVQVVVQEGKGMGVARRQAIEAAQGLLGERRRAIVWMEPEKYTLIPLLVSCIRSSLTIRRYH